MKNISAKKYTIQKNQMENMVLKYAMTKIKTQ